MSSGELLLRAGLRAAGAEGTHAGVAVLSVSLAIPLAKVQVCNVQCNVHILFVVAGFKLTLANPQFYIFQVIYIVFSPGRSSDVV